jgi:Zn-dependent protease
MKIGSIKGISVYIHWSFWLLVIFYLVSVSAEAGLAAGLTAVGLVLGVFLCVLLHEFGHAGAAARYGIGTTDITLLPFGGVARLKRMPEEPLQELVIALAGPAVNVAIAILLMVPIALGLKLDGAIDFLGSSDILQQLLGANIVLVLFNLLPAFPMDGGRVLRSLIAMRTSHLRATEISARVGRWMAMFFALFGFWYAQYSLMLVAAFIFIAGTAELMSVKLRAMARQQSNGQAGFQFNVWSNPPSSDASQDRSTDIVDAIDVKHIQSP